MRKLGISIYAEKSTNEEMFAYLDKAKKAGFSRIFSCLLSVNEDIETIKKDFKAVNEYAKKLDFEIIVDVSPAIFEKLNISYKDLSFFKEIGADGLRLDAGFSGNEEAMMTFNPQGLKIEINMSKDTHYIDTIMDYQPNIYNLIGCHNFYPHNYSGLNLEHFTRCTNHFKKYGLRSAAFVTSQNKNSFGPWPVSDGLCTLEMHRHLPLDIQIKHYIALGNIDDIIISNCYPSNQELEKIAKLNLELVTFEVETVASIPEVEEKILFEVLHFNRGDYNDNMIRSTQSRVKFKGHNFALFNTPDIIKRGDIVIESSLYGHYAGELQIAKKDMKNSGKSNIVGHIKEEELFLLEIIKPWQKFRFCKGK